MITRKRYRGCLKRARRRAAAVAAATRGWCVFPLVPDSKIPAVKWVTRQEFSSDPEYVARWFEPRDNIGVALGPSGLLVVDLDRHGRHDGVAAFTRLCEDLADDGDWPDTLTVHTAGGGYHLYFTNPERYRSSGALPDGIDVKGDGGLVVAPGSVIDGRFYEVEHEAPVADLPEWLEKLITAPKPGVKPHPASSPAALATMPPAKLHRKVNAILEKVAGAAPGERNSMLHWGACRISEVVTAGRLTAEVAEDALLRSAWASGLLADDREYAVLATIRSGLGGGA